MNQIMNKAEIDLRAETVHVHLFLLSNTMGTIRRMETLFENDMTDPEPGDPFAGS